MDEILTAEQVAKILQVHPFTVLKFIKQGKLKASKLGRVYRIRRRDVDEFLDNQIQTPGEPKNKTTKSEKKGRQKSSKKSATTNKSITKKTSKKKLAKPEKANDTNRKDSKDQATPKSRKETVGPPIEVPTTEVPETKEPPTKDSQVPEPDDRSQRSDLDHYKLEI
ncbi:MAG TPA: helix-turn-helix domain-containing protein [Candidatus Gracilibacteria bacterium]|mgnify:CR=1 FL=1|nr:helix-turn-helix domain-containing protein [Candidatus Gracilibacteria bacterium]